MFKAIISRDNGCPWGDTGMSTTKWLNVPTRQVTITDLIATQPGVLLHALTTELTPVGGDTVPHVIDWQGDLYLEDGHHRALRALLVGKRTLTARVLKITGERE